MPLLKIWESSIEINSKHNYNADSLLWAKRFLYLLFRTRTTLDTRVKTWKVSFTRSQRRERGKKPPIVFQSLDLFSSWHQRSYALKCLLVTPWLRDLRRVSSLQRATTVKTFPPIGLYQAWDWVLNKCSIFLKLTFISLIQCTNACSLSAMMDIWIETDKHIMWNWQWIMIVFHR